MDISSWLPYSLGATLLLGISMAFYKSPAAKGHSRFATMTWFSFVCLILSVIFFYSFLPLTSLSVVGGAAVWGSAFILLSLLQMYALSHIGTGALFPITTTTALILTIIIGLIFFKDEVSSLQIVGMVIAVSSIYFYLRKKTAHADARLLVMVGTGIILLSTFNKIWQKLVAVAFDIHVFQIYQYLFALVTALIAAIVIHKKGAGAELKKWQNIRVGVLGGIFGFFGGYILFIALSRGPVSLINTIHSLYVLPTAIVASILFKEKLTKKTWLLITGTIVAIALIKLG